MNSQNFFELYTCIRASALSSDHASEPAVFYQQGPRWACAGSENTVGLAMHTEGNSIPPVLQRPVPSCTLGELTEGLESWNLEEASLSLAAANACLNTPERIARFGCAEPFENYCTAGIDFTGKRVGCVGHLKGILEYGKGAASVSFLEREPKPGDYPDSACEVILPECDIVLITGSAFINKTMPRLLELCRNAYTILTGPSVPLCPELLDFGIDRLAGMAVVDRPGLLQAEKKGTLRSPYCFGIPFLLKK